MNPDIKKQIIARAMGLVAGDAIRREALRLVAAGIPKASAVKRAMGTCGSSVPVSWRTEHMGLAVGWGESLKVIPWSEVAATVWLEPQTEFKM